MASQRRAPTKRPPRPAAKKPPPPPGAEGADEVERVTKAAKAGAAPAKSGATATKSGTAAAKSGATAAKSGPMATKSGPTAATKSPSGPVPKTNSSGPNYRPPSGAARSRSAMPPPRRKKPRLTRKTIGAIVALALVATLVVFFSIAVNGSSTSPTVASALAGPEQVEVPKGPALAAVDAARYPQVIDGIKCETSEQLVYHIHAHLTIFVNGQARQIPGGIGIAPPLQFNNTNGPFVNGGSCFYWLHSHAADGIMHIESPTQTTYTLGQWFDVWGQPLKTGQVGPAVGTLKAFVDGKPFTGDPRTIPLGTHSQIQLDVGSPAPTPATITFPSGL
jgi:hypothetical protein